MVDKRFVLLGSDDNVLVCCNRISAGETVLLNDKNITLQDDINLGHKVARWDIPKGTKIIKYGVPIGTSTRDINFGEHVHMHNLKSDYIPSHTRESKVEIDK